MARRANGNGTYIHIVPIKCHNCKDFNNCTIKGNSEIRCRKRDIGEHWVYQYYVKDINGKKIRKALQAKSRRQLEKRVELLRMGTHGTDTDAVTVGQWCDVWLEKVLPNTVKKSTLSFYKNLIKYADSIRKKRLARLSVLDLQGLYSELLAHGGKDNKPLSPTTVRSFRAAFITCLDQAVEHGYLTVNVAKKSKPPMKVEKEIGFLTQEQIQRLLDVVDSGAFVSPYDSTTDDPARRHNIRQVSVIIRLALATGMRRGEIFGLTWDRVDFDRRTVRVDRNLQGGKLQTPKTGYSIRTISVDADTMERLRAWQERQKLFADEIGDLYCNPAGLVFTNSWGTPMNLSSFRSRVFVPVVAVAGLPDTVTFHSLRHTHATQLLAAGVDAKTVSVRLGHSSVAFTLRTYVHVLEDVERGPQT